ncbi:hypothetical protein Lal_00031490 [Lupinus albus]|nr:hypothetical protein Lal_00031490 [Lupinus albus]
MLKYVKKCSVMGAYVLKYVSMDGALEDQVPWKISEDHAAHLNHREEAYAVEIKDFTVQLKTAQREIVEVTSKLELLDCWVKMLEEENAFVMRPCLKLNSRGGGGGGWGWGVSTEAEGAGQGGPMFNFQADQAVGQIVGEGLANGADREN